jgi:hypothetical protein
MRQSGRARRVLHPWMCKHPHLRPLPRNGSRVTSPVRPSLLLARRLVPLAAPLRRALAAAGLLRVRLRPRASENLWRTRSSTSLLQPSRLFSPSPLAHNRSLARQFPLAARRRAVTGVARFARRKVAPHTAGHDFRRTRSSTSLLQLANGIFAQTPCLQSQPYATISNSRVRRVLVDMPLAWWSMAFLDGNYQLVRSSCACENLPLRWVVHGFSRTAL